LYRGCFPLIYDSQNSDDWFADLEDRVNFAIKQGKEMGFLKNGASVVLVSGWKFGPKHTNTIRIIAVDEKTMLRY
jgi:pyruvate kinase